VSAFLSSRRRFLSSLGLGLGSLALQPLAARLHGEAWGAAPRQKRVVFIAMGNGLPDEQLGFASRQSETDWHFHEALAPLAPWKQRMVVLRNLTLGLSAMQHSGGYGVLTGLGAGDGERAEGNGPQGISIDQVLAGHLGADTPFRSVLCGVHGDRTKVMHQNLFAAGRDQPVAFPVTAARLHETLFPAAAGNQARLGSDRRVLARMKEDVTRLRARLAGTERARLDQALGSLEEFDRRRSASACLAPNAPPAARGAVAEVPAMLDMVSVALRCGMTNVAGVAVGCGNAHYHWAPLVGPHLGTRFEAQGFVGEHGHDGNETYAEARTIAWRWLSTEVASFLRSLEQPGPDGRPFLDDTTVVLFSDGGHAHHNLEGSNWRFIVIGDAGGRLKTGGRFLSYRWDVPWEPLKPGTASVASLWCSLANAVGLPMDTFAPGGGARTNGPLPELMA
jgi:hypothetical protein